MFPDDQNCPAGVTPFILDANGPQGCSNIGAENEPRSFFFDSTDGEELVMFFEETCGTDNAVLPFPGDGIYFSTDNGVPKPISFSII